MMYRMALCLILASMTSLVHGQTTLDRCGACDAASCAPTVDCAAGVTVDPCGCCFVCGRLEGEKCDNYTLPLPQKDQYGFCGENMACLLRTDTSSTVNGNQIQVQRVSNRLFKDFFFRIMRRSGGSLGLSLTYFKIL